MAHPPEHTALLQRHDFVIPASVRLDEAERQLLVRFGRWLEALAKGTIRPVTPEQERFVRVARGDEEPATAYERAWVNYIEATTQRSSARTVGPMEVNGRLAELAKARRMADAIRAEREARREEVLATVRAQLDQIEAAYSDELHSAEESVKRYEAEVREAVLQLGESARVPGIYAMYARGRTTWDTPGLLEYAKEHPDVQQYKRVGQPIVSLRYQAEGS